jgi:hypothetical protein
MEPTFPKTFDAIYIIAHLPEKGKRKNKKRKPVSRLSLYKCD